MSDTPSVIESDAPARVQPPTPTAATTGSESVLQALV
jgi:hypothetical protein